ncbi:MAG: threonylcarbamoyl-AMP synthase [Sedimentisphaerales bacterium]|nr:threonylcarbamoyl-AMP synthase [Sedimentisphaerales bacterium]
MNTEIVKVHRSLEETESAIARACGVLDKGGLVAFPTETVYGLAARTDRLKGLVKLRKVKDRPGDKPFTLHIGQKWDLERYVPHLGLLEETFLSKAWPGPLTVIFHLNELQQRQIRKRLPSEAVYSLYYNNSIGIRLPDHLIAQQLLSAVNGPVVAPSANLAGATPTTTGAEVYEQLNGHIDLIIDAGPTRYKKSSTVVDINGDEMRILRVGVLDPGTVERMYKVCILCVCTGNTCRSPMAEGIFKARLAEKLSCSVDQLPQKGYKVVSAGVMAMNGSPASPEAVEACREMGVDISNHKSQPLTENLVNEADLIYVMDMTHYAVVKHVSDRAVSRTELLAGDDEIHDPIGMTIDTYRHSAEFINNCVLKKLDSDMWSFY